MLYIGNLWPERFPAEIVLDSLKELKNVTLDIYAPLSGHEYNVEFSKIIIRFINNYGLENRVSIKVVDLDAESKRIIYNNSDFIILPFKGVVAVDPPLTMLEAMACSCIVIATRMQSMPNILNNNGFLIDKLDKKHLTRLIKNINELSISKKTTIVNNARETILENFNLKNLDTNLLNMYEMVLK
jgi:glycosyltransferase involved in cell wall biosynthesis